MVERPDAVNRATRIWILIPARSTRPSMRSRIILRVAERRRTWWQYKDPEISALRGQYRNPHSHRSRGRQRTRGSEAWTFETAPTALAAQMTHPLTGAATDSNSLISSIIMMPSRSRFNRSASTAIACQRRSRSRYHGCDYSLCAMARPGNTSISMLEFRLPRTGDQ